MLEVLALKSSACFNLLGRNLLRNGFEAGANLRTRIKPSQELTYGTRILVAPRVRALADSPEGGLPHRTTEFLKNVSESPLARPCFIHSQGSSHKILGIKLFNGL